MKLDQIFLNPSVYCIMNINAVNRIYFGHNSYGDYRNSGINIYCIALEKMLLKINYYSSINKCSIYICYARDRNYQCTFDYDPKKKKYLKKDIVQIIHQNIHIYREKLLKCYQILT